MVDTKQEPADLSDEAWRRIRARVDGLSDAEYPLLSRKESDD